MHSEQRRGRRGIVSVGPVDPPSRGVVDPAPPGPPGPPAAASVFAARSHAAANSFVRSFTPMPTPIET